MLIAMEGWLKAGGWSVLQARHNCSRIGSVIVISDQDDFGYVIGIPSQLQCGPRSLQVPTVTPKAENGLRCGVSGRVMLAGEHATSP